MPVNVLRKKTSNPPHFTAVEHSGLDKRRTHDGRMDPRIPRVHQLVVQHLGEPDHPELRG